MWKCVTWLDFRSWVRTDLFVYKIWITLAYTVSETGPRWSTSQIAKTPGSTSIRYRSDTNVSDRYLMALTSPRGCVLFGFLYGTMTLLTTSSGDYMMTSSNGNIFRVTDPLCGEFTGPGEFPAQRPVTRSFDVFFDLRLNQRLSKQPWDWWFETPVWSLWPHRNDKFMSIWVWRLYLTRDDPTSGLDI